MAGMPFLLALTFVVSLFLLGLGMLTNINRTPYWLTFKAWVWTFGIALFVCVEQAHDTQYSGVYMGIYEPRLLPDVSWPGLTAQNWFWNALLYASAVAAIVQVGHIYLGRNRSGKLK